MPEFPSIVRETICIDPVMRRKLTKQLKEYKALYVLYDVSDGSFHARIELKKYKNGEETNFFGDGNTQEEAFAKAGEAAVRVRRTKKKGFTAWREVLHETQKDPGRVQNIKFTPNVWKSFPYGIAARTLQKAKKEKRIRSSQV